MKKRFLFTLCCMVLIQTIAFAQRPERIYTHKALLEQQGLLPKPAPAQKNTLVLAPQPFTPLPCPDCASISFNSFGPNPTYISQYGQDSVWSQTFTGLYPSAWSGKYLNFKSGCLNFTHYADNSWPGMPYWDGFTVSKTNRIPFPCDTACASSCNGLASQFSSITGGGVLGANDPYTVGYYGYDSLYYPARHCAVKLDEPDTICGVYLTNNAYAVKTIKCGDALVGNNFVYGDYFYVTIKGYLGSTYTGSVVYYLADFRTLGKAYIVDSWKRVNLTSLGLVDSLSFQLTTSDVGDYGPNTPMYFCMDEIKVGVGASCEECLPTDTTQNWFPVKTSRTIQAEEAVWSATIAPNPVISEITLNATKGAQVKIFDTNGNLKYSGTLTEDSQVISIEKYKKGIYKVLVSYGSAKQTITLLKE
jgi:hypothetical protein